MERSPMLMDWHNQYYENDYPTKNNQHVQCNSNQNPSDIYHRDQKISPKVHLEAQRTANIQGNTEQKEQCWRYQNTKGIGTKTPWYWHKHKHEDQWNIIEDPDMNSCIYTHLIFDKSTQNI
jgi:hypothetical protein